MATETLVWHFSEYVVDGDLPAVLSFARSPATSSGPGGLAFVRPEGSLAGAPVGMRVLHHIQSDAVVWTAQSA